MSTAFAGHIRSKGLSELITHLNGERTRPVPGRPSGAAQSFLPCT
jgi:hypothetical protein